MNRYRVTEIVRQAYVYEVEAESPIQARDKVRQGKLTPNEDRTARTEQLDATYEAKEIW